MKLVCISDTHMQMHKVELPEGDILIHAGDLTGTGRITEMEKEIHKLSTVKRKYKHIIYVAGNHDWLAEHSSNKVREMCVNNDIIYLEHESIAIEGVKFFGSPYTPEFGNWAFNKTRGESLKKLWKDIPEDTQVLITHGPPYSILDACPPEYTWNVNPHVGCEELYLRVKQLKELKVHVFGHIHHSYGMEVYDNKTFINASICTEKYKPTNKPIVIEVV